MIDGFLLVRITAPQFCAGLRLLRAGNVCAPILQYMRDWPESRIRAYCKGNGWRFELVDIRGPDTFQPIAPGEI